MFEILAIQVCLATNVCPLLLRTYMYVHMQVHQQVAVDQVQNDPSNGAPYFVHQAGVYQNDSPYTDDNFYSPTVASHCTSKSCTVASWGQNAHVPTNFVSNVLFVNKYENCGDGVVRYTQVTQNFAETGSTNERLMYLNTPWSGVRPSNLADILEADAATSTLEINSSNGDPRTTIYPWGSTEEVGMIKSLDQTAGFTTFTDGIWPNNTATPLVLPCKKPDGDCYNNAMPNDPANCMVASCTDDQVNIEGYQRIAFQVPSSGTNCMRWGGSTPDNLQLACAILDSVGYGRQGGTPEGQYMFTNSTGGYIRFTRFHHFSWSPNYRYAYFFTGHPDDGTWTDPGGLRDQIEATFPPNEPMVASDYVAPMPPNYDPAALPSLTFVFGKGDEYQAGGLLSGGGAYGRRRVGTSARDFTVWTVNHIDNAGVASGQTYHNTQYLISGKLGDVETKATTLSGESFMDEIDEHEYDGRSIHIYTNNKDEPGSFGAAASDVPSGITTACGQGTITCSGSSTPGIGLRAYFFVQCGSNTYFGPDQYYFMPGRNHTEDAFDHQGPVRAYACEGQPANARPTWKLMGYFPANDAGCASIATHLYDETFCDRTGSPTSTPTAAPTTSRAPSSSPTDTPIHMELPCIKPGGDCTNKANPNDPASCMVTSCTDDQVLNEGYIRLELVVPPEGTGCHRHGYSSALGKIVMGCRMHTGIYGRQWPTATGSYKFLNSNWESFPFVRIHHWTWDTPNKNTYIITDYPDTPEDLATVQALMSQLFPPGEIVRAVHA